jgi:hypothetical protein
MAHFAKILQYLAGDGQLKETLQDNTCSEEQEIQHPL